MNYTIGDLGVGAAIGYGASMAMDRPTGWYLKHQSKQSRRRAEGGGPR